jgi:hypothetical protein
MLLPFRHNGSSAMLLTITAVPSQSERSAATADDALTISAISVIAAILTNLLHEGVGHGLTALLTGAKSGVLTTVAWSSAFDSHPVEAGGTLANLAAALLCWLFLRSTQNAAMPLRYFILIACAFNLFTGTGYFFFSGVTNFGDWAAVIAGLHPHWLWRALLVVVGVSSYYAAVLLVGIGLVRYVGVARDQQKRLRQLTIMPYFSAVLLACVAGLLNPFGIQLLWQSALPATAGGQSGLLWLQYYIPRGTEPNRTPEHVERNSNLIVAAGLLALVYIAVLGRGITLHR